jgi:biotin transporter BioY
LILPTFLAYRKNKTLQHRLKRKSYVAQLVLILLGVELLFLSSFTAFNLPTATAHNWQRYLVRELHKFYCHLPQQWQTKLQLECSDQLSTIISPDSDTLNNLRYSLYVPQAPAAIFLGYVLGWPLAVIASAIYILLGLFGPLVKIYPFACGSGIDYYLQPGFGYLLGMIIAAACVGYISQGNRTSTRQLVSLLAGLLCIHGIGLAYMIGIGLFDTIYNPGGAQLPWSTWLSQEARNLSWYALPYDFIFSLALIGLGFPLRWLAITLTAPDLTLQNDPIQDKNLVNFRPAIK